MMELFKTGVGKGVNYEAFQGEMIMEAVQSKYLAATTNDDEYVILFPNKEEAEDTIELLQKLKEKNGKKD